jgi:lysophospholipase L1-like esterase
MRLTRNINTDTKRITSPRPKLFFRFSGFYKSTIAILFIGLLGAMLAFSSTASVPYISLEAELGLIKGNARNTSDVLASKGGAIQFNLATPAPTSMKLISTNKPAFASFGTARDANDLDYDTKWWGGNSGWLAYDLSSEALSNRQSVVVAWYTDDGGYTTESYAGSCGSWGTSYLSNYTIEVNSAPGGGNAPSSGWQTMQTVSGNGDLSGMHRINFAGFNWIRINGSGPNGIGINVDVADASAGVTDGWLFLGDSITTTYATHNNITNSSGVTGASFTDGIRIGTSGANIPLQLNGAMPCTRSWDAIIWLDRVLATYQGKYVTLNFGTNDGWNGTGNADGYYENMQNLVDMIRERGMIAVVPTIPWPNNTGQWQIGIEAFNSKIFELYNNNPDVIRGPDLYSITKGRPNLYRGAGDVHFNDNGNLVARNAWIETALQNVYAK